jgi:hypothetical protein
MTIQPYMMLFMVAEVLLKADEGVQGSRNVLASGGHEGLVRGVARGARSCSASTRVKARSMSRRRNAAAMSRERPNVANFIWLMALSPFGMVQGSCAYSHRSPSGCFVLVIVSLSKDVTTKHVSGTHQKFFLYVLGRSARTLRWRCVCGLMKAVSTVSPCCNARAVS